MQGYKSRILLENNHIVHKADPHNVTEMMMCAKGLCLCLFAVVILHCCAAKEGREESNTRKWKSILEIVNNMPEKIVVGCREEAVKGAVSRLCTNFGPVGCQSVADNIWKVYSYLGLATGTLPGLQTYCNTLGDGLVQLVQLAVRIGWYELTSLVGYALSSGGHYLLA